MDYFPSPPLETGHGMKSDPQVVTRIERTLLAGRHGTYFHPIRHGPYSSATSPSDAPTATPLRSLSHTHACPRGSISYHQLSAIVRPDCRTWCHQPAGRYSVSPALTSIIMGCAASGRDPARSGCDIDDQRTSGVVGGEGFRRSGDFSDSR